MVPPMMFPPRPGFPPMFPGMPPAYPMPAMPAMPVMPTAATASTVAATPSDAAAVSFFSLYNCYVLERRREFICASVKECCEMPKLEPGITFYYADFLPRLASFDLKLYKLVKRSFR